MGNLAGILWIFSDPQNKGSNILGKTSEHFSWELSPGTPRKSCCDTTLGWRVCDQKIVTIAISISWCHATPEHLKFPKAVLLNLLSCRKLERNANERKRAKMQVCKRAQKGALRGPAATLFISRDTCNDSIAKLFCVCFCGVSHNYRAIRCKMGYRTNVSL